MFVFSSVFSLLTAALRLVSLGCFSLSLLAQITTTPSSPLPSPLTPASSSPIAIPEESTSNLITNNPFVPKNKSTLNPSSKKPTGPQSIANKAGTLQKYLEFKSIAIINKKKYFSIFNKRTNKSFWIPESETVETLRVSNYNPTSNSITITDGINTETIAISDANDNPLNVVSATAQSKDQDAVVPPVPNPTNQNNKKAKPPPRRRVIQLKR